jgi:hypothetical protein
MTLDRRVAGRMRGRAQLGGGKWRACMDWPASGVVEGVKTLRGGSDRHA